MDAYNRGRLGVLACESGRHFAEKVVARLREILEDEGERPDPLLRPSREIRFSNTEVKTEIDESIRNQDLYIFQDVENNSKGFSVNDNLMALKTAINAARFSNAHCITAVIPVYPYARQDKSKTREGISAAMVATELEGLGVSRIITLDLHNEAIAGFFRRATLENLRASESLIKYINNKIGISNLVIVAPDAGGAARANFYAKKLGLKLALIHKERDYSKTSTIENMSLIGEVEGRDVFVVDDMIDTAGTVVNAAKKLKDEGAKRVFFAASLALFNGPVVERIDDAYKNGWLDKVVGTNVVFRSKDFAKEHPWYEEVPLERYFARVIFNINKGLSISRLME
ncbi:ribose-phosphate diphosphokinase [Candidatus Woesearchaeota archaeon]|nr:ribose-phosphate diphosphokinase [Candidatus Woesearchaeota archaeon]